MWQNYANSGDKLLMRKLQYTIPAIRKGIRNLENCNYKALDISAPVSRRTKNDDLSDLNPQDSSKVNHCDECKSNPSS